MKAGWLGSQARDDLGDQNPVPRFFFVSRRKAVLGPAVRYVRAVLAVGNEQLCCRPVCACVPHFIRVDPLRLVRIDVDHATVAFRGSCVASTLPKKT